MPNGMCMAGAPGSIGDSPAPANVETIHSIMAEDRSTLENAALASPSADANALRRLPPSRAHAIRATSATDDTNAGPQTCSTRLGAVI